MSIDVYAVDIIIKSPGYVRDWMERRVLSLRLYLPPATGLSWVLLSLGFVCVCLVLWYQDQTPSTVRALKNSTNACTHSYKQLIFNKSLKKIKAAKLSLWELEIDYNSLFHVKHEHVSWLFQNTESFILEDKYKTFWINISFVIT